MADITLSTVAGSTLGGSFTNIPAGVIVMWSGSIATIPGGFYLCDGTNGTPDLRNKFVIGANSDTSSVAYATIEGTNTKTGGTKDTVVVSHTHPITDPGHAHSVPFASVAGYQSVTNPQYTNAVPGSSTSGSAVTGISVGATGVAGTNQNLPPYYALAYIMKG